MDNDTKSLIVAGDTEFIYEVLLQLYNYELHIGDVSYISHSCRSRRRSTNKEPKPSDGVDIMNLDVDKELMQTENCLEFIILSLCQSFNLEPVQAAGLLTNANQYLNQAVIKGTQLAEELYRPQGQLRDGGEVVHRVVRQLEVLLQAHRGRKRQPEGPPYDVQSRQARTCFQLKRSRLLGLKVHEQGRIRIQQPGSRFESMGLVRR